MQADYQIQIVILSYLVSYAVWPHRRVNPCEVKGLAD